jgi:hypothetical protein
MLKASPLIHGVGNGLSSTTLCPARAAANVIVGKEFCCTFAEEDGCCIVVVTVGTGTVSDTHDQEHVYAISGQAAIHQTDSRFETRVVQPL